MALVESTLLIVLWPVLGTTCLTDKLAIVVRNSSMIGFMTLILSCTTQPALVRCNSTYSPCISAKKILVMLLVSLTANASNDRWSSEVLMTPVLNSTATMAATTSNAAIMIYNVFFFIVYEFCECKITGIF